MNPIEDIMNRLKNFTVDGTNCKNVTYPNTRDGNALAMSRKRTEVKKKKSSETTILIFLSKEDFKRLKYFSVNGNLV